MAVAPQRRLFTSSEYHMMLESGILSEDDRVELIEGEILEMAAIRSLHAGCASSLDELLQRSLQGRSVIWIQNPVRLNDFSEPEPDVVVLRFREDHYRQSLPEPGDVLLLVEVAESSLDYDRKVKMPLYARSGIPEAWLVDLVNFRIEVYREPEAGGYRQVQHLGRGERLAPQAFPELVVDVDTILG